jgi:hypothetical protein
MSFTTDRQTHHLVEAAGHNFLFIYLFLKKGTVIYTAGRFNKNYTVHNMISKLVEKTGKALAKWGSIFF